MDDAAVGTYLSRNFITRKEHLLSTTQRKFVGIIINGVCSKYVKVPLKSDCVYARNIITWMPGQKCECSLGSLV